MCPCKSALIVPESVYSSGALSNGEFPSPLLKVADLHKLVDACAIDLIVEFDSSIAEVNFSTKCFGFFGDIVWRTKA